MDVHVGDAGIAILGLALLYMLGKKNGVIPPSTSTSTFITERYFYRTSEPARLAVEFEDRLEENKEDIKTWERKHPTAIPVLTKAISYKTFLQEKPVKVSRGIYEIK